MKSRMRRTLGLLFLGASVVPLVLVTAIGYVSSRRSIISLLERQTAFSCLEIEERFTRALRRLQDQFVLSARGGGTLPEGWGNRVRFRDGNVDFYFEDLVIQTGLNFMFTELVFADAGGAPRYRIDYQATALQPDGRSGFFLQTDHFRPEDGEGFENAAGMRPAEVRSILPEPGSGSMVIRMVAPLHAEGRFAGALRASFDASDLLESILAEMSLGKDVYHFLVDSRTGVLFSHPDFAKRNQLLEVAIPALGASFAVDGEGWRRFRDEEGNSWLCAHRRLPDTPWVVAVAAPLGTLLAPIQRVGWLSLVLVLVVLSGASAIIYFFTRRFRHSLSSLTAAAEGFSSGELQRRVDVRTDDEMGALAGTFNRMATQLQQEIDRREESARFESFHRLSAALTHDLKSSVFSLSLLVDNMDRHLEDPEFLRDSASTIRQTLEKMRKTSQRLSERPSRTMMQLETVPLSGLLRTLLKSSGIVDHPNIELAEDIDPEVTVVADPSEMERLLLNLLHNGVEAMPEGGTLRVSCTRNQDGGVVVVIEDTGVGMTPEFLRDRLFRPFASTKERGVGLGLHDCKEIVDRHHGRIEVESRPGDGTRFTVTLSVERPDVIARDA
jgi:signal transduction histidine kinase